jgi:hypothetical protein
VGWGRGPAPRAPRAAARAGAVSFQVGAHAVDRWLKQPASRVTDGA